MAPTKEKAKVKKAQGDDAENIIMDYLRKQNRPYSATDVSANLHNKVTKTAAAKILKDLHDRNQLIGRASGKQLVYHTIQDATATRSPEQLAALESDRTAAQQQTAENKARAAALKAQLATLRSTPSMAELRAEEARLRTEVEEKAARLEKLKGGEGKPVSAEEKEKSEAEMKRWTRAERERREIAREMWAVVGEMVAGNGQSVEQVKEDLGITVC